MRVFLIEHDKTEAPAEVPENQNFLVAAGVTAEVNGERLPVFIRDVSSAANAYLIEKLRQRYEK